MLRIILDLVSRFKEDDVPALSSQLAFNIVLSFFPFLIFLMTLIAHTSLSGMTILMVLSRILPESIFNVIKDTVLEIVNTKNTQLMSFSLIVTLWSASAGFHAVMKGLNNAYGIKESRSFIRVRIISMFSTIGITFLIIFMALVQVFGRIIWKAAVRRFIFPHDIASVWGFVRYIIIILTSIGIFVLLYRFVPSRKLTWAEVLPGAFFSTASLLFVSMIFAYYVNNFPNYSVIYGSLGAIVILLIWLFLFSVIVIMGGEINACLSVHRKNSGLREIKNIKYH